MPKRDYGYYITREGDRYHQEKACASKGGTSRTFWYADAHQVRNAARDKFNHPVTRCNVCCSAANFVSTDP